VIFDGGKYDIISNRITFQWFTQGIVHMIFPQLVATLDFSYNSRFPHDPNNLQITAETPATRKALNKEEWVESYYKGAKPSSANKKQALFAQYLPWVAIVLVVIVAFYLYTNIQGLANQMSIMQNTLNVITK